MPPGRSEVAPNDHWIDLTPDGQPALRATILPTLEGRPMRGFWHVKRRELSDAPTSMPWARTPRSLPHSANGPVSCPKTLFYPGVMDQSGDYSVARPTSTSGTHHYYVVTIPLAAILNLFVDRDLAVLDENGNSVTTRAPSTIAISGGAAPVSRSLSIQQKSLES
jgi:hypothetical protein